MTIRKQVRLFSDAMEHKLRLKDYKGGWHDMSLGQLFQLLKGEIEELEEAVTEGNTFDIMAEAADVGNYAMMIMDNAIRRITDVTETEVRGEEKRQSSVHTDPSSDPRTRAVGTVQGCAVCGETNGCGHTFQQYYGREPASAAELGTFHAHRARKTNVDTQSGATFNYPF